MSVFGVVIRWKIWPEGGRLRPADRATAVRAVFRGEDVGEDQLAPAVAELARFVMKSAERSRRQRWALWVIAGIAVVSAVNAGLSGPVLQAVVWWAYVGFWAWILLWLPGRQRRDEACAVRARLLALDRMAGRAEAGDG
jgi:hypothetical protein